MKSSNVSLFGMSRMFAMMIAFVTVFLAFVSCTAKPESFLAVIQKKGQEYINAIESKDVKFVSQHSHPIYLKLVDGDVAGLLANSSTPLLRKQSFRLRGSNIGTPQIPQVFENTMVSFVPVRRIYDYDHQGHPGELRLFGPKTVTIESYLVAVSANKGKKWTFFESTNTRDLIDKVLPDMSGKLVVPGPLVDVTSR